MMQTHSLITGNTNNSNSNLISSFFFFKYWYQADFYLHFHLFHYVFEVSWVREKRKFDHVANTVFLTYRDND